MGSRTLSVVIPAYNAEANIERTVRAVCDEVANDPPFTAEIVLIDDGSTDATVERAVAAVAGRVPLRVVAQENSGRFTARRVGVETASGEWVLLLDSRVTLHPGSLRFVETRLDLGERVWNGHVDVLTEGNPFGGFWKAIAFIAWRDYLADPRPTSFGTDDFDRYPKGTGCFLAPRSLLLDAMAAFASHYGDDLRFVSDDTAVIRWIAERERIHLAPPFSCDYSARSDLPAFFRQGVYRGTTFVDGHLRPASRFFPGAVAFFPISVLLVGATLRKPVVAPVAVIATVAAAGAVARASGCPTQEARSFAALAPVYAVAHGAGMWRGLALAVRSRLTRGRT